jgi:hypothetical protein
MCVMPGLIRAQCVQNMLRRGNTESSCEIKDLIAEIVPRPEQKFLDFNPRIGVGLK